jgi:hypothetical protein
LPGGTLSPAAAVVCGDSALAAAAAAAAASDERTYGAVDAGADEMMRDSVGAVLAPAAVVVMAGWAAAAAAGDDSDGAVSDNASTSAVAAAAAADAGGCADAAAAVVVAAPDTRLRCAGLSTLLLAPKSAARFCASADLPMRCCTCCTCTREKQTKGYEAAVGQLQRIHICDRKHPRCKCRYVWYCNAASKVANIIALANIMQDMVRAVMRWINNASIMQAR